MNSGKLTMKRVFGSCLFAGSYHFRFHGALFLNASFEVNTLHHVKEKVRR